MKKTSIILKDVLESVAGLLALPVGLLLAYYGWVYSWRGLFWLARHWPFPF